MRRTNPDNAVILANRKLKLAVEKGYSGWQYRAYISIGISYAYMSNYNNAIFNFRKGIELAEKSGNAKGTLNNTINTGNIYYQLERCEKTLELFYAKEFAEATALFNRISKQNPGDLVAGFSGRRRHIILWKECRKTGMA